MKAAKPESITVRIEPSLKTGLKVKANQKQRNIANMIGVMTRDYCGRNVVEIGDLDNQRLSVMANRKKKDEDYAGAS